MGEINLLSVTKKDSSKKIIGVLVTVLVIVMLIISGPATAFDLGITSISDTTPEQGDAITFITSVEVNTNELVPIQNLSLDFSDGTSCYFAIDGTPLTAGCTGLLITPDEDNLDYANGTLVFNFSDTPYDYGYGYGYAGVGSGILSFNITMDTTGFDAGELNFSLSAHLENDDFSSDEQTIVISVNDDEDPTVVINPLASWLNAPFVNLTTVAADTAYQINISANGTGTNISNATIIVDDTNYTWADGDFACTTSGSEIWNCLMPYNFTNGSHIITAVVWDNAGGAEPGNMALASVRFMVDGVDPNVTINDPAAGGWSNDNTTPITFTYNDEFSDNADCTVYVNEVAKGQNDSALNGVATIVDIGPALADGLGYVLRVGCTDDYVNEGTSANQTLNIDTGVPTVTATGPADGNISSIGRPPFTFTLSDALSPNASCTLYVGAIGYNTSTISNGSGTLVPSSSVPDGTSNWNVTCADLASNNGASTARSITFETGLPGVTLINSSFNTSSINPSITFRYTDTVSSTANCVLYFDDVSAASNASTLNNTNTVLTASNQTEAAHSVYVNCTDTGGNMAKSAVITVNVDATAPTVAINSPADDASTYDNTTDINFTFVDAMSTRLSCTLIVNGTLYGTNSSVLNNTATVITINGTGLAEGAYSYIVNCTDNSNNLGSSTARTLSIDQTAPVISDISTSGTDSEEETGTVTFTITTDENATCWYNTEDFTAEDTTGTTVLDGTELAHTFAVAYDSTTTIGPYYVSCRDTTGNNMTISNSTGTISVSITVHRGSGGGGGAAAPSNPSATKGWSSIMPGTTATMSISNDELMISDIEFSVKEEANNVKIQVEKLLTPITGGLPDGITIAAGDDVFAYLKITVTNLDNANIVPPVKIKFQVPKSWFVSQGVEPSDIVMKRFVDGAWTELPTTELSSDDQYIYYEAESPGFSYFAIGVRETPAEEAAPPVTTVQAEPTEPAESTTPPAEAPAEETTPAEAPAAKPRSMLIPVLTIVAIVLAVLVIIFLTTRSGGRKGPKVPKAEGEDSHFHNWKEDK